MKTICKMRGGSHTYGLNTPTSDEDWRGVWLHTEPRYIIGLDKWEHIDKKGETDEFYWEARHFLNLMRKTNSQAMELIWNNNFLEITPEFKLIQDNKEKLHDSEKFYKSIKGYLYNEFRLTIGERTGLLGSKRKNQLEQYGFSPKNLVQYLRLCFCAVEFFKKGIFPVNIMENNLTFGKELLHIKTKPEEYNLEWAEIYMIDAEKKVDLAFDKREINYKFDLELANDIICQLYKPLL